MSPLVVEEVRRAELALADVDALWRLRRAGVAPLAYEPSAWWEALRDSESDRATRRAAGLVSVPTSDTAPVLPLRSGRIAQACAHLLGESLGMFRPDPDASRIAKLRQAVGFTARVHCQAVPGNWRAVMVTLTYRGTNADWSPRHVSEYVKRCRQWLARRGVEFRYAWVAELQKRGVIHYHVATWLPPGVDLPKPDQCGWWPHGMTRIEVARAAVAYLMKYLSKGGQASDHKLPGGARAFGVGGLGAWWRLARRWLGLPGFVQCRADVDGSAGWRRAPGGGWSDPDGVIWPSEFQRVSVGGVWMLERVKDHGRPAVSAGVAPSGPFCFVGV